MKYIFAIFTATLIPWVGNAQLFTYFDNWGEGLGTVLATLIPVFIALAFLVFVWGLVTFIFASDSDSGKDEGKRKMIWGIIALFVITAIWGILAVLKTITGATATDRITPASWY